jgi:hypothetical protein
MKKILFESYYMRIIEKHPNDDDIFKKFANPEYKTHEEELEELLLQDIYKNKEADE